MWEILRNRKFLGLKFRRQHGIGEYIADFYCSEKKIVIEIDGDTHFKDDAVEYDKIRTEFFNSVGIKVIRFTNNEVYQNIKEVLEEIERETYPHPSPLPVKERGVLKSNAVPFSFTGRRCPIRNVNEKLHNFSNIFMYSFFCLFL